MHPMLNIAVRAARQAGSIITRNLSRIDTLTVSRKGQNDFVSEVDRQAEQTIIETIQRSFPDHSFLAEESGRHGETDYLWIIDPLDGTTNFLHGFPVFSVSIGLQYRGQMIVGLVYDPMRQELFTCAKGEGAMLDDRRIRVSKTSKLDSALLGTGFPYRDMGHLDEYLAIFRSLIGRSAGIRRPGSAALDLAYVACGRLDGFWEYGLKPWDMAAGSLLIREAGGVVSDFAGGSQFLENGDIVAGNIKVAEELKAIIQSHIGKH